jgi:hypothetical protein
MNQLGRQGRLNLEEEKITMRLKELFGDGAWQIATSILRNFLQENSKLQSIAEIIFEMGYCIYYLDILTGLCKCENRAINIGWVHLKTQRKENSDNDQEATRAQDPKYTMIPHHGSTLTLMQEELQMCWDHLQISHNWKIQFSKQNNGTVPKILLTVLVWPASKVLKGISSLPTFKERYEKSGEPQKFIDKNRKMSNIFQAMFILSSFKKTTWPH